MRTLRWGGIGLGRIVGDGVTRAREDGRLIVATGVGLDDDAVSRSGRPSALSAP